MLLRPAAYSTFWGVEAGGFTAAQIEDIRTRTACAVGINQARRCVTTAIVLGVGLDPWEEVLTRCLLAWTDVLVNGITGALMLAWRCAADEVLGRGWRLTPGPPHPHPLRTGLKCGALWVP